jgi:hypothetical protein
MLFERAVGSRTYLHPSACVARGERKCNVSSITKNVARYRKLIALAESDPSRDEARYQVLLRLLAEEEAKEKNPIKS